MNCGRSQSESDERQCWPDHRMQPDRCIGPEFLGKEHQASDNMADDDDRHIGRRIVGAVVEKFLAAIRADVVDLEIGAENPPCRRRRGSGRAGLCRWPARHYGRLGAQLILHGVSHGLVRDGLDQARGIVSAGHIDEFRNVIWYGQQPHPVLLWNTEASQPQLSQSEPDGQPWKLTSYETRRSQSKFK